MLNTKSCEIQLELLDSSSPPQVPCSLHSLIFVFVFVLNTHTHTLTTLLVFSQTRVEKGTRKGATGCKREYVESQPKLKHERGGVVCRARRLPRDPGTLAPPCCLSPTALGPHGAISALDFLYASHHQRTGRVHPKVRSLTRAHEDAYLSGGWWPCTPPPRPEAAVWCRPTSAFGRQNLPAVFQSARQIGKNKNRHFLNHPTTPSAGWTTAARRGRRW